MAGLATAYTFARDMNTHRYSVRIDELQTLERHVDSDSRLIFLIVMAPFLLIGAVFLLLALVFIAGLLIFYLLHFAPQLICRRGQCQYVNGMCLEQMDGQPDRELPNTICQTVVAILIFGIIIGCREAFLAFKRKSCESRWKCSADGLVLGGKPCPSFITAAVFFVVLLFAVEVTIQFVCETGGYCGTSILQSCEQPEGVKFGSHCYNFYENERKNWIEANEVCQRSFMSSLLYVNSLEEDLFIRRQLASMATNGTWYIGATSNNLGIWSWKINSYEAVNAEIHMSYKARANDAKESNQCLLYSTKTTDSLTNWNNEAWVTNNCTEESGFICKRTVSCHYMVCGTIVSAIYTVFLVPYFIFKAVTGKTRPEEENSDTRLAESGAVDENIPPNYDSLSPPSYDYITRNTRLDDSASQSSSSEGLPSYNSVIAYARRSIRGAPILRGLQSFLSGGIKAKDDVASTNNLVTVSDIVEQANDNYGGTDMELGNEIVPPKCQNVNNVPEPAMGRGDENSSTDHVRNIEIFLEPTGKESASSIISGKFFLPKGLVLGKRCNSGLLANELPLLTFLQQQGLQLSNSLSPNAVRASSMPRLTSDCIECTSTSKTVCSVDDDSNVVCGSLIETLCEVTDGEPEVTENLRVDDLCLINADYDEEELEATKKAIRSFSITSCSVDDDGNVECKPVTYTLSLRSKSGSSSEGLANIDAVRRSMSFNTSDTSTSDGKSNEVVSTENTVVFSCGSEDNDTLNQSSLTSITYL